MSVVINTNSDALRIQKTLTSATDKLSQTMQRMSSGLKINSAKDDAAGTVIAARMNVQIDGNKIAQQNVQNANAMLSTAEGNVDVVLDNVSRIRDLTLQAKNGTYSSDEIAAMQAEIDQRIAEIDRVSESAKYSQLKLFGGDLKDTGISFQVGTNATANDVIDADSSLFKSVKFGDLAVKKGAGTVIDDVGSFLGSKKASEIDALKVEANNGKVFFNESTGLLNIVTLDTEGNYTTQEYTGKTHFTDVGDAAASVADGALSIKAGDYYVGNGTAAVKLVGFKGTNYEAADTKPYESGFDLASIISSGTMEDAVTSLDNAIDNLTNRKSLIGSLGNRLDSAFQTLTTQQSNLASAKSIITDADIASEAATYTQSQILQQVSTSLLAQANQAPSIALSLL